MNKNEVLTAPEFLECLESGDTITVGTMDRINAAYRAKLTAGVELPVPVAKVLLRQDEDGREPVMFYGGDSAPDASSFKDRFELVDVYTKDQVLEAIARDRARLAGQEVAYWHAECDDPDYSAFFPEKAEALARISDHGGTITPYYAAPVPAQAEKVEPEAVAKYCFFCQTNTHDDQECWSTRPTDFKGPPHFEPTRNLTVGEKDVLHRALIRSSKVVSPPTELQSLLDAAEKEMLDFVLANAAFIVWHERDGSIKQCQLWSQDDDENIVYLSGEHRYFNTERDAIRAALQEHGRKVS